MIFDALVGGFVRNNAARALVSIVAIALGVAAALTLRLTGAQSARAFATDRTLFTQHVDLAVLPFGSGLPQSLLARVRYANGVASALPVVERPTTIGVSADGSGGDAARLIGVDLAQGLPGVAGFSQSRPGPFAPSGAFVDPAAVFGTNGAIVSHETAIRLHLHRGSSVALLFGARVERMRVANVLPPRAVSPDPSFVFVDVATAQRIVGEPGRIDRIDIVTSAPPDDVRRELVASVGGRARVVPPASNAFSLGPAAAGLVPGFGALASIGLAVAGLLVFGSVGTSVAYRRGDVGTLLALGVAPSSILAAFLIEGSAYGTIGGLLGAALGQTVVGFVAHAADAGFDAPAFDVWDTARAIALGAIVATASSLGPALSAARTAPALSARRGAVEATRPRAVAIVAGLASAACLACSASGSALWFAAALILGIAACWKTLGRCARFATRDAPPSLRIAGSGLAATPNRIAVAVAALAVAVFAAVAFDVTGASSGAALRAWAARGIPGDIVVRPFGAGDVFDERAVARVRATPGIASVVATRTIETTAEGADVAVRGEDPPTPAPSPLEPAAALDARAAGDLRVRVGDTVHLRTGSGSVAVRVSAVRPDFSDARGTIVVARSVLRDAFGDDGVDAIRVSLARDANGTDVANAIVRRLAPERVATTATGVLRNRLTTRFDGTFAILRRLAEAVVVIAAAGVASALFALVLERRSDLRLLRTVGATRVTIARMVVAEAVMLAVAGSAAGLGAGIAFAAARSTVPLAIPVPELAETIGFVIATAVVSPLLALSRAADFGTGASR